MHSYRCYFLDRNTRIAGEMTIHGADLDDAIDEALAMLNERSRISARLSFGTAKRSPIPRR
jgi:hypothetical protein